MPADVLILDSDVIKSKSCVAYVNVSSLHGSNQSQIKYACKLT